MKGGAVAPKDSKEDLRKSKSSKKKLPSNKDKESADDIMPNFDQVQEAEVSIGFQDGDKSMAEEGLLKQESFGSKLAAADAEHSVAPQQISSLIPGLDQPG